ncbi:hypothetical protein SEA_LOZINAK_12 [Gordonia phage Lozinak]|uniref:Uncharacterized protein n=2 Tax=Smoothievirus smoothie TaxID=1982561 RepID=A0A2D1GFM3_9CAUD|nr:hypothetical protein BEN60_gp012 [Gordonia phage Smoothie]ATN90645.1 hypothetical protein SEA_LOZINAK_12 [Gordonia phage Lozinak]AUE23580.1 hypothetical protein SEA_TONIANN_12 [Gordonia phage Toniann]QKY79597.1 hypothetical protein SEA_ENGINEER_12 [Gordonia Phage Engineer]QYC53504.1 hypothetical protein SEA_NORVS_12 [Gordonia phage Norvs]ANA86176.1 hypothetical protein PBI_SMOOTHIE_12 [Gordonia phage Smoothie]
MKVRELITALLDEDMDADVAYNDSEGGTLPVDTVMRRLATPVLDCRGEPWRYDPRSVYDELTPAAEASFQRIVMLLP